VHGVRDFTTYIDDIALLVRTIHSVMVLRRVVCVIQGLDR